MIEVTTKVQNAYRATEYLYEQDTILTYTFVRLLPDKDFYGDKFNPVFHRSLYRIRELLNQIVGHYSDYLDNPESVKTRDTAKELLDSFKEFSNMCEVTIRATH